MIRIQSWIFKTRRVNASAATDFTANFLLKYPTHIYSTAHILGKAPSLHCSLLNLLLRSLLQFVFAENAPSTVGTGKECHCWCYHYTKMNLLQNLRFMICGKDFSLGRRFVNLNGSAFPAFALKSKRLWYLFCMCNIWLNPCSTIMDVVGKATIRSFT